MRECWPLRRPCFHPSVSCEAGNDVLSSVATIFHTRRRGASVGQRIVAACGPSRRLAALADRQFSLFSCTLGLVERPDAAGEKRGLYPALSATTITLLLGLAVAVVIGTGIGLLIGVFPRFSRAVGPLLEFLRAIPPPAIVPVAILFMGYDERMKLTVVVLAAIWPILLNTSSAAERVHPLLLDVARSFRLSAVDRMRLIILPSVVPAILLGIRLALPVAIVVTLLVEILTSIEGIG